MLAEPSISSSAAQLPTTSASEMKRQGWRSVMASHLLITNHNVPEAVILPPEQYEKLVHAAQKGLSEPDPHLETLRLRFRQRMKGLLEEGANERLGKVMSLPLKLNGTVIAGDAY